MDKKYFYFNEFCFLVRGERKAAVYNLLDGEAFALDENISKFLDHPGASIKEKLKIANSPGTTEEKIFEFLEELVSMGLGRFSEENLFVDKINLDFKENLEDKAMVNLKKITIKVTNKCKLNCIFCNRGNSQVCFPCNRKSSGSFNYKLEENIQKILEDAVVLGCDTLIFVGGDPFLEELSFLRLLTAAADKIKNVEIFTNLSSITGLQKETISGYENIHLFYPFFGSNKETFAAITREGRFFDETVKNALDLKNRGIKVTAFIMKRRDKKMEESIAFCKTKGIDYKIFAPTPLVKNKEICDLFDGFRVIEDEFPETNYNVFFRNTYYNSCLAQNIAVDLDGDIMPCLHSADSVLGNIYKKSLGHILREGKQDRHWNKTKDHVDGCKSCEYRYCCSADCLVAAKNFAGKIDAQYPFCDYDPHSGAWQAGR